jgi:hypothetical protein
LGVLLATALCATAAHARGPDSTLSLPLPDSPDFGKCNKKIIRPNQRPSHGNLIFNSGAGNPQLDLQIAVGGGFVMTATNIDVVVHEKSGAVVGAVELNCLSPGTIDPKLVYSQPQHRFVLAGLQNTADKRIKLLFSKTSNPTAGWLSLAIAAPEATDGGSVGYSYEWVAYSYPTPKGESMVAVRWSDVYDGGAITVYRFVGNGIGQPVFTPDGRQDDLYFVHNTSFKGFELNRLARTPAGSPDYATGVVQGQFRQDMSWAPKAPQQNSLAIASGDWNPKVAVLRSGSVWFQGAVTSNNRSVVRWYQVDLSGKVQQSGEIVDPAAGVFNMHPSLAVNKQNDVLVGYTQSSSTSFPSPAFSYRTALDRADAMPNTVKLEAGVGPVMVKDPSWQGAFGDYSGSSVDGDNDLDLWTIQSIGQQGTSTHGTLVARLVRPEVPLRVEARSQRVKLQSFNYPDRCVRPVNAQGNLMPVADDLAVNESSFKLVPGLAGTGVSFESVNHPGQYLRHQNFRLKLQPQTSDALFRNDATFQVMPGLADAKLVSFRSVNEPKRLLRHRNFELWLDEQAADETYLKDATFTIIPGK